MRDKTIRIFGLLAVLVLAVSLSGAFVFMDIETTRAQTGSLVWTRISIPHEDNMQLYPGSDVGPIAVSSDGQTLFAAVQDGGDWDLLKSIDGGYTWRETGLAAALAALAPADTGEIVYIKLSPRWNDDGAVFVATENRVYRSQDRGNSFDAMTAVPGTVYDAGGPDIITSLDAGLDGSGRLTLVLGTSSDVYMWGYGMWVWTAQNIGAYQVLAVAFSPDYARDSLIVAVATDVSRTVVRTKFGASAWGAGISDAVIKDYDFNDFVSDRACIGFPDNYTAYGAEAMTTLFVGLSADDAGDPLGDVYRIDGGFVAAGDPSIVTDLNVRGWVSPTNPTETNIWSIAVSGNFAPLAPTGAEYPLILAGTEILDPNAAPSPPGQFLVYMSNDGGDTWIPDANTVSSCKQPTGEEKAFVALASATAFAATSGDQSAISVSMKGSQSWNQRGLIDTSIDVINDMMPSAGYFVDDVLYIVTSDADHSSLWRTRDGGTRWERIYCSSLTGDPPLCAFDMVRVSAEFIYVAESGGQSIRRSVDGGATFPGIITAQEDITAFGVQDSTVIYTGDANGNVWRSDFPYATWNDPVSSDIPSVDTIVEFYFDNGDIYASTNNGGLYGATGGTYSFDMVGPSRPGGAGDIVTVAPDLLDGGIIYVGIQGSAAKQGIWRLDLGDSEAVWERIADSADVGDVTGLACGENGVLYATSLSTATGWRSVNPTSMREAPEFEEMNRGLGAGDSVTHGLRIVSDFNLNELFAIGGPLGMGNQLWTTSDKMIKARLLSPASGTSPYGIIIYEDEVETGDALVRLFWREVEDATEYRVQIARDADFVSILDELVSEGTGIEVELWLGTQYFWRVSVIKPFMSQWSDTWSFVTPLGPAPSRPILLSPTPGKENVLLRPSFQWESVVAATNFEFILATNCNWDNPLLELTGADMLGAETAYHMSFDLSQGTNYCWKVRAVTGLSESPWSDIGTFTTLSEQLIEEEGTPVWVWVVISLSALFLVTVLVLIVKTRL